MKRIYGLAFLVLMLLSSSCAEDSVDLGSSIRGVVKDREDYHLIENCLVTLSPGGLTKTTSAAGTFEFNDLEAGEYTLVFSKIGYLDYTQNLKTVAGKDQDIAVMLKCKEPFATSPSVMDFGDFEANKSFLLVNNSDQAIAYEIENIPSWLQLSRQKGTVNVGMSLSIDATADRSKLDYGDFSQNLTITYSGRNSGTTGIEVKCKKVQLTTPTVSTYAQAEEVKQTEFTIKGDIVLTGGSIILNHGHCWSTSQDPTILDSKTDFGQVSSVGSFSSQAKDLSPNTVYYVRAYATNAQGTAYSEQIAVTTQDIASNVWDGSVAKQFAGGSGTFNNPYIINTGGQLMHIKDVDSPENHYKLAQNINLNNHNWLPFELKGTLDGDGYTILNLKVSRSSDYQGLFSVVSGTIKNLTICGVDIQAPSNSSIGAFAGELAGTISNSTLLMTVDSKIIGNKMVGGIVGEANCYYNQADILGCSVTSYGNTVISGSEQVGGIIGYAKNGYNGKFNISNCHTSISLKAESMCGGIIGYLEKSYQEMSITNCSFNGNIEGESYLGGILGYAKPYDSTISLQVVGCKSITNIKGKSSLGGIIGYCKTSWGDSPSVTVCTACYSDGKIKFTETNSFGGGICGNISSGDKYCYSTMTSSSGESLYVGNENSPSISETDNIVTFFKELYSPEVEDYYNLDNTWSWSGIVDGKQKTVVCPKLAWE